MNYGDVAVEALKIFETTNDIVQSWKQAANKLLDSESMKNKGCPRSAFLGLCSEGLVKGVQAGHYTSSVKNRRYAVSAVEILRRNSNLSYSPKELWDKINIEDKAHSHNHQMEVICALWNVGKII